MFQGMVVNGFINVSLSSIEKRFNLSSTDTGLIAAMYDILTVRVVQLEVYVIDSIGLESRIWYSLFC